MKYCTICKQFKSLHDFGNNKNKKDGKQGYCKSCSKLKDVKHYKNNEKRRIDIATRRNIIRENNSKYIYNWFLTHPCVDCGESDPAVLEFDHRKNKEFVISQAKSFKEKRIIKEINKCDVRCANCHRKRHAKENNWYAKFQKIIRESPSPVKALL